MDIYAGISMLKIGDSFPFFICQHSQGYVFEKVDYFEYRNLRVA